MAAIDTKRNIRRVLFNGNGIQLIGEGCTANKLPQVLNKTVVELTAVDLEGMTSIPKSWQNGNTYLKIVELPEGLTTIDYAAFNNNSALEKIIFPESLTSMPTGGAAAVATISNAKLTSLTFPSNLKSLGSYCICNCGSLKEVVFTKPGPTRTTIGGHRVFSGCSNVKKFIGCSLRNADNNSLAYTFMGGVEEFLVYDIGKSLSCTSSGLTLNSIIHTAKQLIDKTGTDSQTLTLGNTNIAKIANTYVKLIAATEEMIADDDLIESKLPCEVCESTDEGAMLLEDYIYLKNWKLA